MKTLLLKIFVYAVLIVLCLELTIRVFHLTKDYPKRYVDEYKVEKWQPNQNGHSVTGIRRQNYSSFKINQLGFNSYREFNPSEDAWELAIVGDSFIEGFHEDYFNSIGAKIEKALKNQIEVYEFGYAGYDLADQLHLIKKYSNLFDKIDRVIIYLDFQDDLKRAEYKVETSRMMLETGFYAKMKSFKLFLYLQRTGWLSPLWKLKGSLSSLKAKQANEKRSIEDLNNTNYNKHLEYISNFKSLIDNYGYDKQKNVFLLDKSETPQVFIDHLINNGYSFINYDEAFKKSNSETTLIYDQHWNSYGRSLIAQIIISYLKANSHNLRINNTI